MIRVSGERAEEGEDVDNRELHEGGLIQQLGRAEGNHE